MLYHLLDRLAQHLGFLRVFRFTTTRILAAAITSLLISFLLGPWFIARLRRLQIGQQIRDDGPQSHLSKKGTPTMGGSLILLALVVPTILWCDLSSRLVWLALAITVSFGAVGFIDDYLKVSKKNTKGLPGKLKLGLLLGFSIAACAYLFLSDTFDPSVRLRLALPFADFDKVRLVLPVWVYIAFTAVIIVAGTANAVNLTDGLDGLAIGPVTINAATFLVFAYLAGLETIITREMANGTLGRLNIAQYLRIAHVRGAGELAIYCSAMFGAGIGFLWYNSYPASVFMGDVGSLSLGGGIGMLAVLTKNELTLAIVGGLFVVEALSVMIQVGSYKLRKKRVFRMAPIHHHFEVGEDKWAEPKIIVRFWIISILLALIALGTLKVR
jgi:phospho-N-acetylmuramoyl-pentapeptide-transferase